MKDGVIGVGGRWGGGDVSIIAVDLAGWRGGGGGGGGQGGGMSEMLYY